MKKYKISSFAKHMGVSLDLVKHYQENKILRPEIDPINKYRYYNITHGERLIVSKKFRNLGFTVEETSELISCKDGIDISQMLRKQKKVIKDELDKLEKMYNCIKEMEESCNIFIEKKGHFYEVERPAYYFYRHTFGWSFIEQNTKNIIVKELMNVFPSAVKLAIVENNTVINEIGGKFYHGIALEEKHINLVTEDTRKAMEYIPSKKSVVYIYSEYHSGEKISKIKEVYDMLLRQGYNISEEDIFLENAMDFYKDGKRIENYLIYFTISK